MLDKLLIRKYTPKDRFTNKYGPEQAIARTRFLNENGNNLYIIFPPWHGGGLVYEKLINRLCKKGDAVLAYYFHDEILKPDTDIEVASFAYLRDKVTEELQEIVNRHAYKNVRLIAMSLGIPALSIVIERFQRFDSATLICSGSSLAKSMWNGSRTQHIREGIEQHGQDLAHVESVWNNLAPANHVRALAGKEVSIYVSVTDKIIPTRYQMEFVRAAQNANVNPKIHTTHLGHYATIIKFCLYGKV